MKQVTLKVEGMSCGHCVKAVEGALEEVGAKGIVNLAEKSVQVEYDEQKVTLEAIKEAIEEQGYEII